MQYISPKAKIHKSAYLGEGVIILGPTSIGSKVIIEDYSTIGKPSMQELYHFRDLNRISRTIKDYDSVVQSATIIDENCIIGKNSSIYSGCHLHQGVECEDNTRIGWDSIIGEYTRIMYNAMIYCWVTIGNYCKISGFVCNDTYIGNYVSFFGKTVHNYIRFGNNCRDPSDPAPKINDGVTIGFDSIIIGDVNIGEFSYVAAGSIVTKDIPSPTIVKGVNEHSSFDKWRGELKDFYLQQWNEIL